MASMFVVVELPCKGGRSSTLVRFKSSRKEHLTLLGSCVIWKRRDCCQTLVLMQGIVSEALVFVEGVACEALVLLLQIVMFVRLLCSYKALCLRLLCHSTRRGVSNRFMFSGFQESFE